MTSTYKRLKQEAQTLAASVESPSSKPSNSKKKRLKEVRKMAAKVEDALKSGRIEEEIKDVRIEKVFGLSSKQAMIARVCVISFSYRILES